MGIHYAKEGLLIFIQWLLLVLLLLKHRMADLFTGKSLLVVLCF